MTLIGGINVNGKWALLTDDCLTVGEAKISASEKYRPKLRQITGKNCNLVVASCGSTKDIDFVLNMLEAEVNLHKAKDVLDLQYQIQNVLITSMKALKNIKEDPQFSFLILETYTNTLWATEEYSMFLVGDDVDIVFGSAEQNFHQISYKGFIEAFIQSVEVNEFCEFPIYIYRDGRMYSYDGREEPDMLYDLLYSIDEGDGGEKVCSETTPSNEGGDCGKICDLLSRSGLSCQKTTKLGQNSGRSSHKCEQAGEEM